MTTDKATAEGAIFSEGNVKVVDLEGPKKKQIEEMLKYVPPKHVPDKYKIDERGHARLLRPLTQSLIF